MTEAVEHRRAFNEFDQHVHADRPEQVKAGDIEYEEWDKEPKGSPCIVYSIPRIQVCSSHCQNKI
jgi:hypothetical protein